jgi:hypothetical protein
LANAEERFSFRNSQEFGRPRIRQLTAFLSDFDDGVDEVYRYPEPENIRPWAADSAWLPNKISCLREARMKGFWARRPQAET